VSSALYRTKFDLVLIELTVPNRNPGGVRFGSAELYDVIDMCFPSDIQDCVAVGQSIENGTDERVILFVKLPEGKTLSEELEQNIKGEIRKRRTPRHVPSKVGSNDHASEVHVIYGCSDHTGRGYPIHSEWEAC